MSQVGVDFTASLITEWALWNGQIHRTWSGFEGPVKGLSFGQGGPCGRASRYYNPFSVLFPSPGFLQDIWDAMVARTDLITPIAGYFDTLTPCPGDAEYAHIKLFCKVDVDKIAKKNPNDPPRVGGGLGLLAIRFLGVGQPNRWIEGAVIRFTVHPETVSASLVFDTETQNQGLPSGHFDYKGVVVKDLVSFGVARQLPADFTYSSGNVEVDISPLLQVGGRLEGGGLCYVYLMPEWYFLDQRPDVFGNYWSRSTSFLFGLRQT